MLLLVTVICLLADLGSKYWAFDTIADQPVVVDRETVLRIAEEEGPRYIARLIPRHDAKEIVPGLLDFTLVLNPGAVFGIGPGKRYFFMGFTLVALAGGVLLFARVTRPREHVAHAAIAMLLAGGLGNLYDRLFYGCVRDFIHPLPGVKWPFGLSMPWGGREVWPYVSNVADLFLIIGICILAVYLWRVDREGQPMIEAKPLPRDPSSKRFKDV